MSTSTTYAWNGRRTTAATTSSSSFQWWPTSTTDAWNDMSTSSAYARYGRRTSTSTYAWYGRGTSTTTYAGNGPSTTTDGGIISTASSSTSFASWTKTEKEVGSRRSTEKSKLESGMCNLYFYIINCYIYVYNKLLAKNIILILTLTIFLGYTFFTM